MSRTTGGTAGTSRKGRASLIPAVASPIFACAAVSVCLNPVRFYSHIRYGVIGIPASPFFSNKSYDARGASSLSTTSSIGPLARFAFCKKDETLREAARRLQAGPTYQPSAQ